VSAAETDALARDLVEVLVDLSCFTGLVEIATKDAGKASFDYESWFPQQRRFEKERTGRDFIVKGRQMGISALELARDFAFARTHEGANVVAMVHTSAVKAQFFSTIRLFQRTLFELGVAPAPKKRTETTIRWDDIDSSITVIEAGKDELGAANRGRSGTIHRLHASEIAFYGAARETMTALLAATEDRECVIESTANGTGGPGAWFYEKAQAARDGLFSNFTLHFYPWFENPSYRARVGVHPPPRTKREQYWETELRKLGCDDRQIAWWRLQVATFGLDLALREYPPTFEAAFQEGGETWLDPEHIDRVKRGVRQPLELRDLMRGDRRFPPLRIYERPEPGQTYLVIADPSGGGGKDEAALQVLHYRSGRNVASWHDTKTMPGEFGHLIATVGRIFNNATAVVERNSWNDGGTREGEETLKVLEEDEHYPRLYRDANDKLGFDTNVATRPIVWGDMGKGFMDGVISTPDSKTANELGTIVVDPKTRRPAARNKGKAGGCDDGLLVCLGIGHHVRQHIIAPGSLKASAGAPLESVGFKT
jgi:hypothetical protein